MKATGVDLGALCAERGWSRPRLISALRAEARTRQLTLPSDDSLKRMIREWVHGRREPSHFYTELLSAVFGLRLVGEASRTPVAAQSVLAPPDPEADLSTIIGTAERVSALTRANIDDHGVDVLDLALADVVERYESEGPARLAPDALELRRCVHRLLDGRQRPVVRQRLYVLGGRVAGILGYMAVNRGRFRLAAAYSTEAFELARFVGDQGLQAWARGTQSFAAYYSGGYSRAVELARDGLRYAGDGAQAPRLLVNGEARALARMGPGRRREVDVAVTKAFESVDMNDGPDGLTSCIDFGVYGRGRIAANAATAYLHLGDTKAVISYADPLADAIEEADSSWSRSLVRLDVAAALLRQRKPDLEQAMALGQESLGMAEQVPIRSVWQRSHELAREAARWIEVPAVHHFTERLRDWEERPAGADVAQLESDARKERFT